MKVGDEKLKKILIRENYLTESDLEKIESDSQLKNTPLSDYLIDKGLITRDLLGQAMAESFQVPYADLNSNEPSPDLVRKIPEEIGRKFNVILTSVDDESVTVATDDPSSKEVVEELKKIFSNKEIEVKYGLPKDIKANLFHYRAPLATRFSKILSNQQRVAPEILDEIFSDAFSYQASDIHFEPQEKKVIIRFRIDGVLHEAGQVPKKYYENILNRIKVMSGLRIDEHYRTQDGSMRYEKENEGFDMRTSIVPTVEGEKMVIRVLSSYIEGLALSDLGLSSDDKNTFEKAAKKPFGMILVTGPTGSGKTTTLYSLVKLLNKPDVNITTIEDPVEYKVIGVNQIQVNPQTDLTFAKGLRSIVRQDPDTILVGEIRDEETAEIAVNAALTGHTLLSTFHANDAATAISRLLDMSVESFLLSSTIELVVAQRLVRKICEHCRISNEFSKKDILEQYKGVKKFFNKENITLYSGKGCESCSGTGYKGRTAIFEIISITNEMQELILKNPSSSEVWELASKQGSKAMYEDGIEKVKAGVTTLEELQRVVELP